MDNVFNKKYLSNVGLVLSTVYRAWGRCLKLITSLNLHDFSEDKLLVVL